MIKVNLLGDTLAQVTGKKPDKGEAVQVYAQGQGASRVSFPITGLLVGLFFVAWGAVYYVALTRDVDKAVAHKEELKKKKAELEKYIQLEKTFRDQKEALQRKKEVMLGLKQGQHLPVHFMEELANATPDDVWFKEVIQKGMSISIKGESASFEAINLFRTHLMDQKKWFDNVNYPTANKKGNVVEFTLSFDLKKPA